MRNLLQTIAYAIADIRTRFFHTLLSVLGMVIGVAALVGMLCLVDGMKEYAQSQVENNTDLQAIQINSSTSRKVDGVNVARDTIYQIEAADLPALGEAIGTEADIYQVSMYTGLVTTEDDDSVGTAILYANVPGKPDQTFVAGKAPTVAEWEEEGGQILVNRKFAEQMEVAPEALIGKQINYKGQSFRIIAVLEEGSRQAVVLPSSWEHLQVRKSRPQTLVFVRDVEQVNAAVERIEAWTDDTYGADHGIQVVANRFWIKQLEKGFLLFKVVMGLIVGISVVVGGVGLMNVLLIAVNERKAEIGIRKAVGASKRSIRWQFLVESITISTFGSLLGLLLGVLATLAVVPVINWIVEVDFAAAYTWGTLVVVVVVAIVAGVVFGTYPAIRASRLQPVEAIQRV